MFAKLWGPDDDQVLAILTANFEGQPEITLFGELPTKDVFVKVYKWEADAKGWASAAAAFAVLTEKIARTELQETKEQLLNKDILG